MNMKVVKDIKAYFLWPIVLLSTLQFQNCQSSNSPINFSQQRSSLSSNVNSGGTDIYDGKPAPGNYCRTATEFSCAKENLNIQSVLAVNGADIQLVSDNCTTTSTHFQIGDSVVSYSALNPKYIGVSRGIFKSCDLDSNNHPLTPPETVDEAWCHSEAQKVDVVISRNILSSILEARILYSNGSEVRVTGTDSIVKTRTQLVSTYTSIDKSFDLSIPDTTTTTSLGNLSMIVDSKIFSTTLECRQASPLPTIIIERDLELHSSWIDTSRLAGYWKLNEVNAVDGNAILDSSGFGSSGLLTSNDGINKRNSTIDGGALNFDGIDDFVSISVPADGHLDFDVRSFSYMVWIKKSGNAGAFDMPLWKGGNAANITGWDMECGTSFCSAFISDGVNIVGVPFAPNGNSFIGRWVHLTAVVDRSTQLLKVYVDGQRVASSDITMVTNLSSTNILKIGNGSVNRPFLGAIDDVAVWNYALSDAEVLNIYRQFIPKFR